MDDVSLAQRLDAIETRLALTERYLGITRKPSSPSSTETQPVSQRSADAEQSSAVLKVGAGGWLGIIATICFVLAAGFIIKLSIDSGWLTPARQVGLAIIFGASLIGGGLALLRADRSYASLLPAAGIVILYLSFFAAYRYYDLVSLQFAIFSICSTSALCVLLYLKIGHDVYPLASSVGAYLAPLILDMNVSSTFTVNYFIDCSLVFAFISIFVQSRLLMMISSYLAILTTAIVGTMLNANQFIALTLPAQFLIFSIAAYFYSKLNQIALSKNESWGFFPVLILFYATEYYFLNQLWPHLAPWISLTFAAFLVILYMIAKASSRLTDLKSQPVVVAFVTVVVFHSVYLELLPADGRVWLFSILVLVSAFSPARIFRAGSSEGSSFLFPMMALGLILGIEFFSMIDHVIYEDSSSWILPTLLAAASLWVFRMMHQGDLDNKNSDYGILLAAHLLVVAAFYQLLNHLSAGSLAVSASWLLYAVIILFFAFARKDKVMANSAILVLGVAAGKALLYDVSSESTGIRILCLLLTGIVLYGTGFFIKKISQWETIK